MYDASGTLKIWMELPVESRLIPLLRRAARRRQILDVIIGGADGIPPKYGSRPSRISALAKCRPQRQNARRGAEGRYGKEKCLPGRVERERSSGKVA
jgi:hypothetical protein